MIWAKRGGSVWDRQACAFRDDQPLATVLATTFERAPPLQPSASLLDSQPPGGAEKVLRKLHGIHIPPSKRRTLPSEAVNWLAPHKCRPVTMTLRQ